MPPARAPRAADLFDEIHRKGAPLDARMTSLSARFTETTTSTLLDAPLVATGHVIAERPSNIVLSYDAPDGRVVRILDGRMTVDWPARGLTETKDVRPALQRASRAFMGKSPDELRRLFDITAVVDTTRAGTWRVTLVPRRRQLREGLEQLDLWIDQTSLLLHSLDMTLPGGDRKRMVFTDIVVNPPIGADTFAAPRR